MTESKITSIGQLMTENWDNWFIKFDSGSINKNERQECSLVLVDDYNTPIGIVTERDFVRKVYVNDSSRNRDTLIKDIMSSSLITINGLQSQSKRLQI